MAKFTGIIPHNKYKLVYADPAWRYEMRSDAGKDKSPYKHYDCMTQAEMLDIRDQLVFNTADDCVLVMWTTFAAGEVGGKKMDFILDAIQLMNYWGFQRKTGGPWVKRAGTGNPTMGTGYVLRSAAELFFIGTRGNPKVKNHGTRNVILTGEWPERIEDIDSITVDTLRREHSRKPDEMYELLENLFDGPYLELFGRTTRPGWSTAGNQTDKF